LWPTAEPQIYRADLLLLVIRSGSGNEAVYTQDFRILAAGKPISLLHRKVLADLIRRLALVLSSILKMSRKFKHSWPTSFEMSGRATVSRAINKLAAMTRPPAGASQLTIGYNRHAAITGVIDECTSEIERLLEQYTSNYRRSADALSMASP
jgi:hypothetical protein